MTTPADALRVVMAPAEIMAILDRYGFVCGDRESDCNRARAAIAQALENARRYRWLRHKLTCGRLSGSEEISIIGAKSPADFDAAIDAAIAATGPPMRPDAQPRPFPHDDEGPQPLSLMVPIYNMTEVDLMGAMESLVAHFDNLSDEAKARTVNWLQSKYGAAHED